MSCTSRATPSRTVRSSRLKMARAMKPPMPRASSASKPREVIVALPTRTPARDGRREWIVGNGVLVGRYAERLEQLFGLLAGDARGREVDEAQVIVGAAGNEAQAGPPTKPSPKAAAFSTTAWRTRRTTGCAASPKATALAAMTCMSGPPCHPGNIGLVVTCRKSPRCW